MDEDYALAGSLAQNGDDVTVFLVQNGVLPARQGARAAGLSTLVESGARVTADAFSLRERAIPADKLHAKVVPAELDTVLDALEAGHKVMWL